jgi:hypothetical protein
MRLTIDNLNGAGEVDYTVLLDAEAPPKIVRKLNRPPVLTASLMCGGASVDTAAGSKVRLYRDSGEMWFSGYLTHAPQKMFAGAAMGSFVFRVALNAVGEISSLDRGFLSEHAAMGGYSAGEAIAKLTQEANPALETSGLEDVAQAGTIAVETGALWSAAAGQVADCARAVLTVENRALSLAPIGAVTRELAETDAGLVPESLKLKVDGPAANDITVIGGTEPAMYARDCFTSMGTTKVFSLSQLRYTPKTPVQVEDDFRGTTLDPKKWMSDAAAPLTFVPGGVACAGAVALRYRDRLEIGGTIILEQTGISYGSGTGVVGGIYDGGFGVSHCIAGVQLSGGQIQPVIQGVVRPSVGTLAANRLYEFRTIVSHPEPIRAGQAYASSVNHGANARSSQVWSGTTHVTLTMRTINPADASTTSAPQVVIYDGTLQNVPAYADYEPLWGTNLACTLGHASATNLGAVWVQSSAPNQPWRTRVIGDVTAGAECYFSGRELHFTAASQPVFNEKIEVLYRTERLACGRVVSAEAAAALANDEDSGTRAMVIRVSAPAPRTSLDCEQAARALLDDMTQPGYSGEYECLAEQLPQGASDVHPGEEWRISAASWGVDCTAIVREVEIEFQHLADSHAAFKLHFANDAVEPSTVRFSRAKHDALLTVVSSALGEDVSARPAGLADARMSNWTASTITVDAGVAPVAGGGIEVRVEGDWGWGTGMDKNLVGRFTTQSFSLPFTGVTQAFYLRQYDASTPPRYSTYSTVLKMEV